MLVTLLPVVERVLPPELLLLLPDVLLLVLQPVLLAPRQFARGHTLVDAGGLAGLTVVDALGLAFGRCDRVGQRDGAQRENGGGKGFEPE